MKRFIPEFLAAITLCLIATYWLSHPNSVYAEPVSQLVEQLFALLGGYCGVKIANKTRGESKDESDTYLHKKWEWAGVVGIFILIAGVVIYANQTTTPHLNVPEEIQDRDVDTMQEYHVKSEEVVPSPLQGNLQEKNLNPSTPSLYIYYLIILFWGIIVFYALEVVILIDKTGMACLGCLEFPFIILVIILYWWVLRQFEAIGFVPAELFFERVIGFVRLFMAKLGLF